MGSWPTLTPLALVHQSALTQFSSFSSKLIKVEMNTKVFSTVVVVPGHHVLAWPLHFLLLLASDVKFSPWSPSAYPNRLLTALKPVCRRPSSDHCETLEDFEVRKWLV